jgi:hypothetical protein
MSAFSIFLFGMSHMIAGITAKITPTGRLKNGVITART